MKKILFRVPFAMAVLTTIFYAVVFGLRNAPQSSVILACFSGERGRLINLPDFFTLPLSISDLWNIILVPALSFIAVHLFIETKKSETVKIAISKLSYSIFLVSCLLAVAHFISTDLMEGNYWGPIYGSNMVFLFSVIVAIISFRLRRKLGFLNLLSFNLFLSLGIGLLLSFFSGVPTGLFITLVSLGGTLGVYLLGAILLWVGGENVFTSLDWLRKEDTPKKENQDGRPRYYLAKEGKYLLKDKGELLDFKIFWKSENVELINQSINNFNKKKNFSISGLLSLSFTQKGEYILIFSGRCSNRESPLLSEERICNLAVYVAEKIEQKNVLIFFAATFKELELQN